VPPLWEAVSYGDLISYSAFFTTAPRPALNPTFYLVQSTGVLSTGVKLLGCKCDHFRLMLRLRVCDAVSLTKNIHVSAFYHSQNVQNPLRDVYTKFISVLCTWPTIFFVHSLYVTFFVKKFWQELKLKLKLNYDRQSVGQSVLVSGSPDFFYLWWLQVSCCEAPSLTRVWVCNLLVQLLLSLTRAVTHGSKSRRTHHILLSHMRLPKLGGPGSRIYVAQFYPRHLVPICRLLRLAGLRWRYSNSPPHGCGKN
jgi:hypothetical protein